MGVLKGDAVLERTDIVSEMKSTRCAVAGEDDGTGNVLDRHGLLRGGSRRAQRPVARNDLCLPNHGGDGRIFER
jgi:hypothetical protein